LVRRREMSEKKEIAVLMECLEAKEGVEAQYAGVYILKWRHEWGPPEYLFREADAADALIEAARGVLDSYEAYVLKSKPQDEFDEYDEWMAPRWRALRDALAEVEA